MLDIDQAVEALQEFFPEGQIGLSIDYGPVFVVQVFNNFPGEEGMDPYFSVDKQTGQVRDFSLMTDGDFDEVNRLFAAAKEAAL
jgi:hypothetical protein